MRIAIPVLLILVFAAACGDGDKKSDEAGDSPTTDAVAEPTATATEDAASPTPTEAAGIRAVETDHREDGSKCAAAAVPPATLASFFRNSRLGSGLWT